MDAFIDRLLNENKIQFASGVFAINGVTVHAMPLTNLVTFFELCRQQVGEEFDAVLKEVGQRQAQAFAATLFDVTKLNYERIQLLAQAIAVFGTGTITITKIDKTKKEVLFSVAQSPYVRMYRKLFGPGHSGEVNVFVAGLCQGMANLILDTSTICSETGSILDNKPYCTYRAVASDAPSHSDVQDYTADVFSTLSMIPEDKKSSELVTKVVGHNMLEWRDGVFSIWNAPGALMPSVSLAFLCKALHSIGGSVAGNLWYHIACTQSREAVTLQVKQYGFAKDEKLMQSILDHLSLTGFGRGKVTAFDTDGKTAAFSIEDNPLPLCFKTFGAPANEAELYVAGLLSGMCEAFFESSSPCVDTSSTARGDGQSSFDVSGQSEVHQLDKKNMDTIQEKVTVANFIL